MDWKQKRMGPVGCFGQIENIKRQSLPMHVHVKNGDGKAKINIETAEVVENNGIKPADLNKAVDAVKQYKADMIKAWNEYFDED